MGTMKTISRPDAKDFEKVYEQAYRVFHSVHKQAITAPDLLHACLRSLPNIIENYPSFPVPVQIERLGVKTGCGIVSGNSYWSDASQTGMHVQGVDFMVSVPKPVNVVIQDGTVKEKVKEKNVVQSWFGESDHHVLVLFFAWKAVLSARWAEMVQDATGSTQQATDTASDTSKEDASKIIDVQLFDVSEEAYHWWCKVLSDGSGWTAQLEIDGVKSYSPWSTTLQGQYSFSVHRIGEGENTNGASPRGTSFSDALNHVMRYCEYHNAAGQGLTALFAALIVPMVSHCGHSITLPAPKSASPAPVFDNHSLQIPRLGYLVSRLDKLLTLSCNVRGIKSLLHSAFFNLDVPCNLAGAWLQGGLMVLDGVESPSEKAAPLMMRDPAIGSLWAGVFTLGIQKEVFDEMRRGIWEVDLVTAAVTGTMQSFFQVPSAPVVRDSDDLSLADECRVAAQIYGMEPVAFPPPGMMSQSMVRGEVLELARQGRSHLAILRAFAWRDAEGRSQKVEPLATPSVRMKKNGDVVTYEQQVVRNEVEAWERDQAAMMTVPLHWAGEVDYKGMEMERDEASREAVRRVIEMKMRWGEGLDVVMGGKMGMHVWMVMEEWEEA